MPLSVNIEARNIEKTLKYTPFLTDITDHKVILNCFEISSTGFINKRNTATLHSLHKLMSKSLKRSSFMQNLNALAWYGSYKVWLSREDTEFVTPPFLLPHLGLDT